jgi:dihydroorotate dehydrogenase (fumarate)
MTVDLSSKYLGLHLPHPLVASAGPLTGHVTTLLALESAGAAAVVLPSLFEEDAERAMSLALTASGVQRLDHAEDASTGPRSVRSLDIAQHHLKLVREAKQALGIPVIASLNGTTAGGWTQHAAALSAAGADALELNVYRVVADPTETGDSIEHDILKLVESVRAIVSVPLAVKLGPYFTAFPSFARRLAAAGADGLVLFNRFYEPDIELAELRVHPSLHLSTSEDLRLPLRWTALLKGNVNADLAFSGGIQQPEDVVKALLVGANVVMTTSSLLRHGAGHLTVLRDGLRRWLEEREYESVAQLCGSMAVGSVPDPDAYERSNYLESIQTASRAYQLLKGIMNTSA